MPLDRPPFLLIANPSAGRGRAAEVVEHATLLLRSAGAEVRSELTTSIQHAEELGDAAAQDGQVAVAVGGDGLIRGVAAGVARHGGTLGIVPAGRGNDFARTVGITKNVSDAVRTLVTAKPRATDCIAVNDRVALGNVYLGFDSLSNITANAMRVNLGQFSYTYAALRVALTMPPLHFKLRIDGEPHAFTGSGVTIASSIFYGGAVPVAPAADPHDGQLDVVTFEFTGPATRVAALLAMKAGRHLDRPDVRHRLAREIDVEVAPTVEAYSDGDPIAHPPLRVRVLPAAIKLLRPA
jgi:YegS/Rv2252/BmrU family lipid kinase